MDPPNIVEQLPFEIIEQIFDQLSESFFDDPACPKDAAYRQVHDALVKCQLVSRAFRDFANQRLFRHVSIYSYCPFETHLQRLLALQPDTASGSGNAGATGVYRHIRTISLSLRGLSSDTQPPSSPSHPRDVVASILHQLLTTATHTSPTRPLGTPQLTSFTLTFLDNYTSWTDLGIPLQSALEAVSRSSCLTERFSLTGLRELPLTFFAQTALMDVEVCRAGADAMEAESEPPPAVDPAGRGGLEDEFESFNPRPSTFSTDLTFPLSPWRHSIRNLRISGNARNQLAYASLARESLESVHFNLGQRHESDVMDSHPPSTIGVFPLLKKVSTEVYTIATTVSPGEIAFEYNLVDFEGIMQLLDTLCVPERVPSLQDVTLEFKLYTSSLAGWGVWRSCVWGQNLGTWGMFDSYLLGLLKRCYIRPPKGASTTTTTPSTKMFPERMFNVRFILLAQYPAGISPLGGNDAGEIKWWKATEWPASTIASLFPQTLESFPNAINFIYTYQLSNI